MIRPSDPRLRAVLAPARWSLAVVLLASVLAALLVIAQAFVVAGFVVALVRDSEPVPWAVAVVAVFAGRAVVGFVGDRAATRAAATVGGHLRRRLLRSLLVPGPRRIRLGEATALATRGVTAAEPYVTRYLPALVLAVVLPPLTVIAVATQDLLAAFIVLSTLPLVPVFGALVGIATRDRAEQQWRAMSVLAGHFLDVVKGLPTLVVFRRAEAQSATIRQVTDRYREATARTLRVAFASAAVLELVATLSVAVVAVVVGVRLADGGLDLRTALVVLLLAPEAYWPLRRVGAEFHAAAEGTATIEAIMALEALPTSRLGLHRPGPIELHGVGVRYAGRSLPALAPVDALIPARGVTAVVGPSGSGKSTLLRVLARLVDPTGGTVEVGGLPLDDAWRRQIAWLPQQPTFLSGSVAENLRLARPDATDTELWAALEQVALADRVRRLPGGLASLVGEDGRLLSAGERARLALARVVLSGRPWVLLDEPTAHLDEATEQIIAETIVALGRVAGVVVVAHRPAVVRLADRVLELVPLHRTATPASSDVAVIDRSGTTRPVAASVPAPPIVRPTVRPTVRPDDRGGAAGSPGGRPEARLWWGSLLGALASASGVALTATAGWLIVAAAQRPPVLTLMVAIVGVRAFGLARPVLRYVERLTSHDAALRLLAERRVRVYDSLVPLVPGALGRRRGDALAAVVDDAESALDRELRVRMPVRTAVLVVVLASGILGALHPVAGLVVAFTSLASGGLGYAVARLGAGRVEADSIAARAELSAQVSEVLQAAEELALWQAEERAQAGVEEQVARLDRASRAVGAAAATARAWMILVAGIAVAAVGMLAGALADPVHALVTLVPLALLDVLLPLADAGALAPRTRAADRRLDELAATSPRVVDPGAPRALPPTRELGVRELVAGWGAEPVLRGVTFGLLPGERVGVVGPSGCGKSTLAGVLLRFLDPAAGEVTLAGVRLDALALTDVRRRVGLVDDQPHVFGTTLGENIRLARPGAPDEAIEAVLRRAQLGDWLDALPEGLHTWLGDGHATVSGGERARLAVARSLLADPDILVLDEPTAGLDSATAEAVAADLLDAADHRSVVWITHARTGLDRMDRVLALGGGHRTGRTSPMPPS